MFLAVESVGFLDFVFDRADLTFCESGRFFTIYLVLPRKLEVMWLLQAVAQHNPCHCRRQGHDATCRGRCHPFSECAVTSALGSTVGPSDSSDWLDMDLILPFKTGNFAEAKSFVAGFKGAWFRCKVNDMRVTESGRLEYYLEYIDYTEEAEEWTEVFQKNPLNPASRKKKSSASSQIMLRPPFPQWYRGDQVPEQFSKSDVIASVCDTWKVGDLVEWLCQDCYWTAKITRLLSEDEVEIGLLEPPLGEGGCHHANCKDLRPALDWSMVKGWTVPLSKANGKCWYAARLIHPKSDIEESNTDEEMTSDDDKEEEQKSLKRASDISKEDQKSSNITPSSDTNKSPDTVEDTMAEQNGLSNGTRVRRYPLRSRKFVKYASGKQK